MHLVGLYCRVSTDIQESQGTSLHEQQNVCMRYIRDNNLTIGKRKNGEEAVFLETFSGGFYERPLLSELLDLIKSGGISTIICTRHDRLARDLFAYLRINHEVEEAKGNIIFIEESFNASKEIGTLISSQLISIASFERSLIKSRTMKGRIQHAKQGMWTLPCPYGYIKNPSTKYLEIYEDEACVVQLIYRLYNQEGYTLDGVAKYLMANNIPPPSLSTKGTKTQKTIANNRKNSSGQWIASTIYRILERGELYSGTYTAFQNIYQKSADGKSKKIGERPKDEWIVIYVPAIISAGEGEKALEKLEHNKRFAKKRSIRTYLLRGKLLCDCDPTTYHHLVGYTGQKARRGGDKKILTDTQGNKIKDYYTNYRCVLFDPVKAGEERRCKNHISGLKVERIVLDTIKELFLNPESLFTYASERDTKKNDARIPGDEGDVDYNKLVEKLKTLFKKNERIQELYVDGVITKTRMSEMIEGVETEQEKLKKIIAKEETILRQEAFSTSARATWEEIRNEVSDMVEVFFREASQEELQSIVDLLVDRVILTHGDKKRLIIRLKIPFDLFIADRYYEDEGIYADNEYGDPTCIGTSQNLVPKAFSLGELSKPILTKEVVFDEKGNGENLSENKAEKDKDDESKKGGKGGGTGGNNGSHSAISSAISKMIEYLKVKYHQNCKIHHEKLKNHSLEWFFCFSILGNDARARIEREENANGIWHF